MKPTKPDNRKPVDIKIRLSAELNDLAQLYKEYAETIGYHFNSDSQLIAGVVHAFLLEKGDPDFTRWLRARHAPAAKVEQKVPKKAHEKANGADLSAPSTLSFEEAHK